jgi:hypothetical protein
VEVRLRADQQVLVRQAIAYGRLHGEQDVAREALAAWEERERRRLEIIASVESARAEHARGEGRDVSMAMADAPPVARVVSTGGQLKSPHPGQFSVVARPPWTGMW